MELDVRKASVSILHGPRETLRISNCTGIAYKMNTTGTVRRGKLNEVWVLHNVHIVSCSAIKARVKKGGR